MYFTIFMLFIVSKIFEEHHKSLQIVLDKIKGGRLTTGLKKYKLECSEIKYLGFKLTEGEVQIDEDKIKPILDFA